MRRITTLSVVSLLLISGCGFDFAAWLGLTSPVPEAAQLRKFTSPDELKSYLVSQNQNTFSRDSVFTLTGGAENADTFSSESPTTAPPADGGRTADDGSVSGTPNFSTTTEQEEGVQESDIVKNDGEYLYVLSRGVLHIVRATPASGMVETGSLDLEGSGQEMFLVDGKIVTITTPNVFALISEPIGIAMDFAPGFEMYRPQAKVTVVDISDKSNPTVASEVLLDGTINTSRMIGTQLYLVAVTYPDVYIEPILMAEGGVGVENGIRRGSGSGSVGVATQPKALSLADIELDDILPDIAINVAGQEVYKGNIAAFDDHFRPVGADGLGLTSIVSLDINDPASYSAQTVVAYPANVYASTQAIYLTDTDYDFSGNFRETTNLYKFALTGSGTTQAAAGTVPGRVLNQYSMGEYEGFLRVATTTGPTFEPFGQGSTSTNAVYVLEQVGEKLNIAGKIEGLAPGESVFAARFLGTRGYLVTFKQVDPLFTLDLTNPRDPKVVGELKVPGFSTFIMPMDENHVLTIGRDTNDAFGFTFSDGIRVSIFDVTDFSAPKLDHVEVIGINGSWSEAIDNPKAFTYFAAEDLLAFPVEIFGNQFVDDFPVDFPEDDNVEVSVGGESPGAPPENDIGTDGIGTNGIDTNGIGTNGIGTNGVGTNGEDAPIDIVLPPPPTDSFRGLYVYRVTVENGFELLGTIDTATDAATGDSFFYSPSFTRGAFIGETVYAVTSEGVSAAAIADVATITGSVEFADDETPDSPEGPRPDESTGP